MENKDKKPSKLSNAMFYVLIGAMTVWLLVANNWIAAFGWLFSAAGWWAFKLGYSDNKSARICRDALTKKGLIERPEARYAANMFLDLRGLHDLDDKYIPIEDVKKIAAKSSC